MKYWVIETEMMGPVWFRGTSNFVKWTYNIYDAVKFMRERDAWAIVDAIQLGRSGVVVTEHEDVDRPEVET